MSRYFLRIIPDDPGGTSQGEVDCTAVVSVTNEVLRFPIRATGASDGDAARKAMKIAAENIDIPITDIGW